MALRGTLTHRKTRRLARILGIPVPCALGILEALWHVTAEQQPDGGIGRIENRDIAEEMFYDEDPEFLVNALIESGWLDTHETCRLIVHDWHEHADSYVHAFLAKRTLLFASGQMPDIPNSAFNSDTRKRILSEYAQSYPQLSRTSPGNVQASPGQVLPIPVPVPEPVPVPVPEPVPTARAEISKGAELWKIFKPIQAFANSDHAMSEKGLNDVAGDFGSVPWDRILSEAKRCRDYFAKPKYTNPDTAFTLSAPSKFRDWLQREGESLKQKPDKSPSGVPKLPPASEAVVA